MLEEFATFDYQDADITGEYPETTEYEYEQSFRFSGQNITNILTMIRRVAEAAYANSNGAVVPYKESRVVREGDYKNYNYKVIENIWLASVKSLVDTFVIYNFL